MNRPVIVKIGAALAAILIILALYLSQHAASVAKKTAHDVAVNTSVRARGLCKSNQELRKLLNDIGDIVVPKKNLQDPQAQAFIKRIHVFTDTNPACDHLPPLTKP